MSQNNADLEKYGQSPPQELRQTSMEWELEGSQSEQDAATTRNNGSQANTQDYAAQLQSKLNMGPSVGPGRSFPDTLLSRSIGERIGYFGQKIIAHPIAKEVLRQVMLTLQHPSGDATLVWIVGPSGAGKTTLCNRLMHRLFEDS